MKVSIKSIISAVALGAVLTGCHPEVVSTDTFAPEFRLMTETFHGGEDFVFRIYSNHSSVIITKYDCEFASDVVVLNKSYSISDGYCEFREQEVTVDETHRGRISLTVKDPDTGATTSFTGVYTAYVPYDNYLRIENEVVSSSKVNSGYPAVIGGDDFTFTIHSNLQKVTLKDFFCEFNDGQLEKGKEYTFSERGDLSFTMKKVKVAEDRFSEPSTLSLTLLDPISGEDIYLEASYVKLVAFTPTLEINPKTVTDGGDFKFRITSNRKSVQMTSFMTTPTTDADTFRPDDLYSASSITMNAEGYAEYIARDITVDSSHNGTLKLTLKDNEYTGREVIVSATYVANVKPGATNISLSQNVVNLRYDDTGSKAVKVTISTTDAGSDGDYSYKILSGAGKCDVSISGNELTLSGTLNDGVTKIQVYPTKNTKVTATLTVNVLKRVALVVKGTFWKYMYQSGSTAGFANSRKEYQHNWHNAPSEMSVSLVTWTSSGDLNASNQYTTYHFDDVTDSGCDFSCDFFVESTTGSVSSKYIFQAYRGAEHTYWSQKKYYIETGTKRTGVNKIQSLENVSVVNNVSLAKLAEFIQDCDDCMYVQNHANIVGIENWYCLEDHTTDWTSFNIDVRNLKINEEKYDLRYVIYQYRAKNGSSYYSGDYWWSDLDNSNDDWCVSASTL